MLVIFCAMLTVMILAAGSRRSLTGRTASRFTTIRPRAKPSPGRQVAPGRRAAGQGKPLRPRATTRTAHVTVWRKSPTATSSPETQTLTTDPATKLVNGSSNGRRARRGRPLARSAHRRTARRQTETGPLGPVEFFAHACRTARSSLWAQGRRSPTTTVEQTTVYYPMPTEGQRHRCYPGSTTLHGRARAPKLADKLDFLSLMLALFCGTGVAAAHPDPLLHGEGPGRGAQEHGRRHRDHRLLLRPDAVIWAWAR